MANTATSFYIDTLGSGSKQTGHPEFELPEAIGKSSYTMELWYKYVDLTWTGWSPLISITNTTVGADNTTLSSAGGDMHFMLYYDSGNPYYENLIYGPSNEGSGQINTSDYNGGNIARDGNWHHIAHTREFDGFCGFWHDGVLIGGGRPGTSGTDSGNTSNRDLPGKRVELGFNRPDGGNYQPQL